MNKKKNNFNAADIPQTLTDHPFYGLNLDDEQLNYANSIWDSDIDIVFCNAKAGCGKTLIAVGVANLLIQYGKFEKLIYIMSPYGERKQGWLPGTITEKSAVYFEALYQSLVKCNLNPNIVINTDDLMSQKAGEAFVTCITDTYLRGSTLDNAVIIIDEAQNYTAPQLKKTLTRVGRNVKVIVIGHDEQCDLDDPRQSGFLKYVSHFAKKERTAFCTLINNYRSWISQWADSLK